MFRSFFLILSCFKLQKNLQLCQKSTTVCLGQEVGLQSMRRQNLNRGLHEANNLC